MGLGLCKYLSEVVVVVAASLKHAGGEEEEKKKREEKKNFKLKLPSSSEISFSDFFLDAVSCYFVCMPSHLSSLELVFPQLFLSFEKEWNEPYFFLVWRLSKISCGSLFETI